MRTMKDFKNEMCKAVYGISLTEAHDKKICVNCKKSAWKLIRNEKEMAEYRISGLCGECYDSIFQD